MENDAAHCRHMVSPLAARRAMTSMPTGNSTTGQLCKLRGLERFFATHSVSPLCPSKALTSTMDLMTDGACVGARVLVWHRSVMASTGAAPSQQPMEDEEGDDDDDEEESDDNDDDDDDDVFFDGCCCCCCCCGVVVFSTLRTSAVNARSVKFSGAPSESTESSSAKAPLTMAVPPNSSPNVCLFCGDALESDQTLTRSGCDRLTMWCSVSLSSKRVVNPN